tara:strand:+ start:630 stop:1295 length:666 start_codon:yes stop_codon:yes gene_type:complete
LQLALLQPQFAPNLYDLSAMLKADLIVWEDVEKWSRKGRSHRAQIRGHNGLQWINLPIKTEDKQKPIKDVRIDQTRDWFEPLWNAIYHNYKSATYFDLFEDELRTDFETGAHFTKLIDFDIYFFNRMMTYLEIDLHPKMASDIPEYDTFPDQFVQNIGADTLYLEHESKNYQRQTDLAIPALDDHPEYRQAVSGFVPGCSTLDLLFNYGKESFRIIDDLRG